MERTNRASLWCEVNIYMKEKYQKILEHIKHFFVREKIGYSDHKVTQNWLTIIISSVVVVLLLCSIGVYVYLFSSREIVTPPTSTSVTTSFSYSHLQEIVDLYRNQTIHFNTLRENAPQGPDTGAVEVILEPSDTTSEDVVETEEVAIPEMSE